MHTNMVAHFRLILFHLSYFRFFIFINGKLTTSPLQKSKCDFKKPWRIRDLSISKLIETVISMLSFFLLKLCAVMVT